jgi:hypothetical protein
MKMYQRLVDVPVISIKKLRKKTCKNHPLSGQDSLRLKDCKFHKDTDPNPEVGTRFVKFGRDRNSAYLNK